MAATVGPTETELRDRLRRLEAVMNLARRGLLGTPVEQLGREAAAVAASELSAARAEVLEGQGTPPEWVDLTVPVTAAGRTFGMLAVGGLPRASITDAEADFLYSVAGTVAEARERQRTEGLLREVAEVAPVFIWTADSRGTVDFINRGWLEFTGRTREEELGDSWELGVHPEDAKRVSSTWWRAFERRVPWEQEYRLRRHDGEYRWIVDRGMPRFEADTLIGYVGSATEIHERKEMEDRLSVALARDHEVAETLQRSMLPEALPSIAGVELEARYLPASRGTEIGGDFYDAVELQDGRVSVVVGDVVGHGLQAAAAMGQVRNAFRAYALTESASEATSPAASLDRLNRLLRRDGRDLMATALHVVIDRDTRELLWSNAGHPPALVVGGAEPRYLEGARSAPLGVSDPSFTEERAVLEPGATLLLFTDGLVERRDTPIEDRLAQLAAVAQVAGGDLSDMCDQLLAGILGGKRAPDDVALLALRLDSMTPDRLELTLAADPLVLGLLRRRLMRFLEVAGAGEMDRFEITLGVCEAASNAIEHAYGPGDADFGVEASVTDGEVMVAVTDSGSWREAREPVGELPGSRGRGLRIIEGLMDTVDVAQGAPGTTVTMRRRLGARGETVTGAGGR